MLILCLSCCEPVCAGCAGLLSGGARVTHKDVYDQVADVCTAVPANVKALENAFS